MVTVGVGEDDVDNCADSAQPGGANVDRGQGGVPRVCRGRSARRCTGDLDACLSHRDPPLTRRSRDATVRAHLNATAPPGSTFACYQHTEGPCKPVAEAVEIVWRFGVKAVTSTPGATWKHVPTGAPSRSSTRPRYPGTSPSVTLAAITMAQPTAPGRLIHRRRRRSPPLTLPYERERLIWSGS
jgi:hypothetical protein